MITYLQTYLAMLAIHNIVVKYILLNLGRVYYTYKLF
jgi:hypothetical protein